MAETPTSTSTSTTVPGPQDTAAADGVAPPAGRGGDPRALPRALGDRPAATTLDAETEAADVRADRRQRLGLIAGRVGVGVAFLALWEAVSGRVWDEFFLSKPSAIVARFVELAASGQLWNDLRVTMMETGIGLVIGMTVGVLLGLFVASSTHAGRWIYPYLIALYSLPRVALAPLFIVWFGIGLASKVIMVVTMVVFVAFYNVHEGVKNIDQDLIDMSRSFRSSRLKTLRTVIIPSITPWLLTALRLAIGLGLIGAVIAELVGASEGLGHYIKQSANLFDTTGVFTGLVVITGVAMILEQGVAAVERRLLRHR